MSSRNNTRSKYMALVNKEPDILSREDSLRREKEKQGFPAISLILGALSFVGMMMSIWMIFLYAPTDAVQGNAQRIFYFHVPIAWIGMLSFGVLTASGIG